MYAPVCGTNKPLELLQSPLPFSLEQAVGGDPDPASDNDRRAEAKAFPLSPKTEYKEHPFLHFSLVSFLHVLNPEHRVTLQTA